MKINNRFYSGRDEKYGVTVNGRNFILKPVKGKWGKAKMMSELAASIVYKQLELPVQNVTLTKWNEEIAVLIEDFIQEGHFFVPFASLIEEHFDSGGDTSYSYENIKSILLTHSRIGNGKQCLKAFWNMFLVDYLIGGGGRNASNWGFIGCEGILSPAPVFDSSSSFYYKDYAGKSFCPPGTATPPRMTFEGTICERIDIIASGKYPECTESAQYILQKFSSRQTLSMLIDAGIKKDMAANWFTAIVEYNYNRLEMIL